MVLCSFKPPCHSRAGGNPCLLLQHPETEVSACAGMTLWVDELVHAPRCFQYHRVSLGRNPRESCGEERLGMTLGRSATHNVIPVQAGIHAVG